MIVCDYCKEEKELTKYIFPKGVRKDIEGRFGRNQIMSYIGPITVEPEEVEICEDCAMKVYHKMNWIG